MAELYSFKKPTLVTLYADNQKFIMLLNSFEFYFNTKESDIFFLWICEKVSIKLLNIVYIPQAKMANDSQIKCGATFGFLKFRCIITIGKIM